MELSDEDKEDSLNSDDEDEKQEPWLRFMKTKDGANSKYDSFSQILNCH